jgi:hypothetical protein
MTPISFSASTTNAQPTPTIHPNWMSPPFWAYVATLTDDEDPVEHRDGEHGGETP